MRERGSKVRAIKGTDFRFRCEDVIAFATVQSDIGLLGIVALPNRQQRLPVALHPRTRSKTHLAKFFRHQLKAPVRDDKPRMNKPIQYLGGTLC